MTRDEFNLFCGGMTATTHVVQWGNADVWKVGGKVFAISGWNKGADAFTFKVSEIAFEVLQDTPGVRPAPYMASRGLKWLQHYESPGLSDVELRRHIALSHDMIVAALTKKKRAELNL
ncbi:MAG: MmcQ/YjbR family DNA-binding protein [Rhodobacteraceae bacterium]|nr:MmcQ/YjbR family DNA-binding protein [Paracoccaceae bacterium]